MDSKRPSPHASHRRSAFSLTELMIAIALSLILILGINAVFKLSSDSIGTGFQLMQMNRQFRLVGNTMNNDMNNMADYQTSPALIIQNVNTAAFRDKTDMASEPNFVPDSFNQANMLAITKPTGGTLYPLPSWAGIPFFAARYEVCDDRDHRTDILSFFAKDQYRRQTGPAAAGTTLASDFTGGEAWIWYGHVLLPDNSSPGNWTSALGLSDTNGANNDLSANPNNFFASQWVLGRMAIVLTDPTSAPPPAALPYTSPYTKASQPQNYLRDLYTESPSASTLAPLPPLGYPSVTNDVAPAPIYQTLCDLAGAPMGTFRSTVLTAEYQTAPPSDVWYLPLLAQYKSGIAGNSYSTDKIFRFWAKPWVNKSSSYANGNTTGVLTQEIARTVPVFGRGCSQFIVEYAGDYLQQDATGKAINVGEDHQLDYDVITNPTTGQTYKRIRWYGLARSLDNGVTVEDANSVLAAANNPPAATEIVRPLWRYVQQLYKAGQGLPGSDSFDHFPFEKIGDGATPAQGPGGTGGGLPSSLPPNKSGGTGAAGYTCAWAPDDMDLDYSTRGAPYANLINTTYFPSRSMLPWLIRVTVRLDDPNGRVPQGQQMEFIFKVNRPH